LKIRKDESHVLEQRKIARLCSIWDDRDESPAPELARTHSARSTANHLVLAEKSSLSNDADFRERMSQGSGGQIAMQSKRDANAVLGRDFLETRSRILEIAAALDRMDRAPVHVGEPPNRRLAQLRQAIEALLRPGPDRAETVQLLFSLEYDPNWQAKNGSPAPRF
jgi:hypothetical protein